MPDVMALVDDLFFQAKMLETAKQLGVQLRTFSASGALLTEASKTAPHLIIVDLNARDHAVETIAHLHASAPEIPLVAFLSHVQTELAQRARDAGAPSVMPRSQFTRELATILLRAKSQS